MSDAPQVLEAEAPVPRLGPTQRNVLSNWAAYGITVLVNFFLSPFIVHKLGDSVYGIWVLMMSLTGYLGLLDLGVRNAVTRYVARFHAAAEHERAGRVVSAALLIFTGSGLVAVLFTLSLVLFGVRFFKIPAEYLTPAKTVLVLAGLNVAVTLVAGVFGGVLIGLQKFTLANAIQILATLLRAAAIVLALGVGKGLLVLVGVQFLSSLFVLAANAWSSLRHYPELKGGLTRFDRQHLSLIFAFSLYSFLLDVSMRLSFHSASVVIGLFLPVGMITFFAIAGNLMNYSRELVGGIAYTMMPLASALQAEGKKEEVRGKTLRAARYASMVIVPIAITFLLRGDSFIGLWMGPAYAPLCGSVLGVLALALAFAGANQVAAATMRGLNRHRPMVPVFLAESLTNLALSALLVRQFGVVGVAWGLAIPSLLVSLLYWPWFLRRELGVPIRTYVFSSWVLPGIAAVPFVLATYALERFLPARNLLFFFLEVALAAVVLVASDWFLCFTPAERAEHWKKLFPRR